MSLKKNAVLLLALLVFGISLIPRIIYLDTIPANLNPDEADNLRTYIKTKIMHDPPLIGFNWNGAPSFNIYLLGLSWDLFNQTFFGLRFPAGLMSSLTIVAFYLLGYVLTKKKWLSFFVSLTLAVNPWFLNFSRSGWENIFNSVTVLLVFWGLYLYYQTKKQQLAISLLVCASVFAFYFYHPGKLYLPALITIFLFISCKKTLGSRIKIIITVSLLSLCLMLPQLIQTFRNPDKAFNRILAISLAGRNDSVNPLFNNLSKNIRGFSLFMISDFDNPLNNRYVVNSQNPISPFYLPFYLLGLVICFFFFPYFLLFYLLVLLPTQVLSLQTPDAARAVHIVPAIYLFILLGINYIIEAVKKINKSYSVYLLILFIVILIGVSLHDLQAYFVWIQKTKTLNAREPAISKDEYRLWLDTLTYSLKTTGRDFHVQQWKEIKQYIPYE